MAFVSDFGYIGTNAIKNNPLRRDTKNGITAILTATHTFATNDVTALTQVGEFDNTDGQALVVTLDTVFARQRGRTTRWTRVADFDVQLVAPTDTLIWNGRVHTSYTLGAVGQSVDVYCDGLFYYVTALNGAAGTFA
jgi:hypothetical protein